jgi:hypothetical protein
MSFYTECGGRSLSWRRKKLLIFELHDLEDKEKGRV